MNRAFSLALPRYAPATAELRAAVAHAEIEHMELYKEQRKLAVTIRFDTYCDAETLAQLSAGITAAYGLSAAEITPRYSEREFSPAALRELLDELAADSPVAARTLSGCAIVEEGAQIRLLAESGGEVIRLWGGVLLMPEAREVTKNGVAIDVREKEMDILIYLAKNRGRVVSTAQLYESVWGEMPLQTSGNTITVHILTLRRKLEDDPSSPKIIRTVWGKGYQID